MTQAQKLNTISSTRVLMRGCVIALFVTVLMVALPCTVKAEMLVFWNFDEYTTEGGVNYVTDSVHSERLKLVNSSIVDGQLSANGGYAQGTVNGTNGVNVTLPLGQSENPNYTMSAFLATTHNVYQGVGIMAWGTNSNYHCNCFRTLGSTGKNKEGTGLKSYWWSADISKNGYDEVYSGLENHVATTGDATNHFIYLNGQLIVSGETHAREEANQNFTVGNTVNNEKLYGTIDNAAVYNEILQHSDIITISSSKVNGLTNWWKSGTTVDRISGVVKPESVTGTTVITGANGDVMVFNRALEAGEQTFYQGQLETGHDYVINNMAGSASTKTTWLQASTVNLNDMTTVPLGIYVGGTKDAATLTATADQLNSVNRTLVLGGGTLAIASDSDVSIDKNRVGFDSGSISTSGTGTITINSSEDLSFKAVNIGNSALNLNSSGDMRIIGSITGSGNLTKSGSGDLALATASCRSYTGALTVTEGTLTFCVQDVFGTADTMPKNSIVIDNATITNNAPYFNNLLNTTFKNGAKLVAANGNGTWKAFMLTGTTKVAFAGDGNTAESPVRFEVASTATGDARTNATICPYGTTFDVSDITLSDDADLIVSAVLANTNGTGKIGSFTKTGAGTMELSGANTYTGVTTVSGGKLNITGSAFASRLIINNGASATIDAGETGVVNMDADGYYSSVMIGNGSSGSLTLESGNVTIHNSGNGTLGSIQLGTNSDTTVGELTINGGSMQVDGRILIAANKSGAQATLTMNGGKLSLGVPESYTTSGDPACGVLWFGYGTSTVNLNGGTVSMFGMNNNGPKAGSTFNFNGGTLQAVGDTTSFLTAAGSMQFYVKQGGAIIDTQSYNVTISAALLKGTEEGDAAGGLTKNGSGKLTLAAANTFSGDITINAGTVEMAKNCNSTEKTATPLGDPSVEGRKITVKSGATLVTADGGNGIDVFGGAEAHPKFTLVADGGTIATSANNLTTYGDIELKNGGVFEDRGGHINGNSSWFTIFNGDISVTSGNATIQSTSNGKGISLRGYRNGTNAGVKFDVAEGSTLTVSALLKNCPNRSVAGSFTKTGKGTMILSNRNNDFTGAIVVDEGILKAQGTWQGVNKPSVLGQYGSRTVTVNSGAEFVFASQDVISNADNIYPMKFIVDGGTITNEGAVFNNLSNAEFSNGGKIVATNGNGNWKAFMVNGTTKIAFAGDGSKSEKPVVFEVASTATGTALTNATICPQTTFDVADITKSDASDFIVTAVLANANDRTGYFTKTGDGTMELAATNMYQGATTISGGTLALTAPNAVYNSKAIVNNSVITAIADQTFRNLSGNGTVTVNDNNLKLITDKSTTFSGTISGAVTLSAEGQGSFDVTGATISAVNLELHQESVVNVPAANAITVKESFRQGNNAKFTFTGASASVSGSDIATQAAITLNGGTMTFNTFAYETSPALTVTDGLALHLDATVASSFDNSSAIKSWKNLADDSNNLYLANINSVSTTAHVTENAKNGLNVVTFPADGSTSYNLQSAINGQTFFAVMADNGNTSDSAFSFLFGNSGGSNYFFHRGTGTALWSPPYTSNGVKNGSTILNGKSVLYDAANIGYDWNVMSLQPSEALSLTAISRDRNIANRGWRGDIAEILVYTTQLTDEQIKAVSQYLATKWQIGADVIEPSVVTTGEFVSNNTFTVAESTTIDVGAFSNVTLGATTINQDKSLSFNVAENQTTTLNVEIAGLGSLVKTGEGALKIYTSSEGQVDVSYFLVSSGRLDMMKFLKGKLEVGKANEPNNSVVFSPGNSVGDLTVDGEVIINGGATLLLEQDVTGMDSLTASRFIVSPDAILDLAPTALQPGATYTLLTQDDNFSDAYNVDFWTSLLLPEDDYYWNLAVVNNMLLATVDANAVPEPSTWALLILGAAGLMYWRRRK